MYPQTWDSSHPWTPATNLSIKYINLPCLCAINKLFLSITSSTSTLGGYKHQFLLQNQKHICWDLIEKGIALYFMHVCDCSKFCFVDNLWYSSVCIIHYPRTLLTGIKRNFIGDQLLPDQGRYGTWHHSCMQPLYHFQFVNMFSSSIFIHWWYNYKFRMDELKSKTNVKSCGECIVIRYIFCVIYGKNSVCCNGIIKVFELMDRVPGIVGRVLGTVGRRREEIAAEYHTCLTSYRAEPGTLNMFHR
jgi:hypothetical protein